MRGRMLYSPSNRFLSIRPLEVADDGSFHFERLDRAGLAVDDLAPGRDQERCRGRGPGQS